VVTRTTELIGRTPRSLSASWARLFAGQWRALAAAAIVLGLLALLPGAPTAPLLLVGLVLGAIAAWQRKLQAPSRVAIRVVLQGPAFDDLTQEVWQREIDALRRAMGLELVGFGQVLGERCALSVDGVEIDADAPPPSAAHRMRRLVRLCGARLLSSTEVDELLARLGASDPVLLRALHERKLTTLRLWRLLRRALAAGLPVASTRQWAESLVETSPTADDDALYEQLRRVLLPELVRELRGGEVACCRLGPRTSLVLAQSNVASTLPEELRDELCDGLGAAVAPLRLEDCVWLTEGPARRALERVFAARAPTALLLADEELGPRHAAELGNAARLVELGQTPPEPALA